MNIYAVVIPKGRSQRDWRADLRQLAKRYARWLGEGYSREAWVQTPRAPYPCHILRFPRLGTDAQLVQTDNGSSSVIVSGNINAERIARHIRSAGGRFRLAERPGGIYSAVVIDRHFPVVRAWSSQPVQDCLYYSDTPEFTIVSNRPLLCALAMGEAELDPRYISRFLSLSYTPDDISPYKGVKVNLPENMISIVRGHLYFTSLPYDDFLDLKECDEDEKVDLLSASLLDSIKLLEGLPPAAFHLSGGKDSRLLLAGFSHSGIPVNALTYGRPSGPECRVASALTTLTNTPHVIVKRNTAADTFEDATDLAIARCDGLIPSAAHQVIYDRNDAAHRLLNQPTVVGHIQLQRGGWARTLDNNPARVRRLLNSQLSEFSNDANNGFFHSRVRELESYRAFHSHLESLYWFNFDFRAGRWLGAQWIDTCRTSVPVYPLLDERFAAICSGLDMFGKVSERLVFQAIRRLDGRLLSIPLFEDRWRFEAKQADPALSGLDYVMRTIPLDKHPAIPFPDPRDDGDYSGSINCLAASAISKIAPYIQRAIRNNDLLAQSISEPARTAIMGLRHGHVGEYAQLVHGEKEKAARFQKFMWRLYSASRWLEGSWLSSGVSANRATSSRLEVGSHV